MIHHITTTLHLPVIVRGTHAVLGYVARPLVQPDTGVLHAFLLARRGFWQPQRFIFFDAVIAIEDATVQIGTVEQVEMLRDHVVTERIAAQRIPVLGQLVVTEGGRVRGRVADFHFDLASGKMTDLLVTPPPLFRGTSEEALIGSDEILRMTARAIIVRDPEARERLESLAAPRKQFTLDVPLEPPQRRSRYSLGRSSLACPSAAPCAAPRPRPTQSAARPADDSSPTRAGGR